MNRIGEERGWPPTNRDRFEDEIHEGALHVGSPETVAQKIADTVRTLGIQRFDLKYTSGTVPHEHLMTADRAVRHRGHPAGARAAGRGPGRGARARPHGCAIRRIAPWSVCARCCRRGRRGPRRGAPIGGGMRAGRQLLHEPPAARRSDDRGASAFRDAPRCRSDAPARTFVLVHGIGVSSRYFQPLAASSRDAGGSSSSICRDTARRRIRSATSRLADHAGVLAAFLRRVRAREPGARRPFDGQRRSSRSLAQQHPDVTDRIVLMSPTLRAAGPHERRPRSATCCTTRCASRPSSSGSRSPTT